MNARRLAAAVAVLVAAMVLTAVPAGAQSACCYPTRPNAIEVSADDRFVYAVGDVTVAMRRDPVTGALETIDIEDVPGYGALLSPDGRHLYVGTSIFERDPATGKLTHRALWEGEATPYLGLDSAAFADERTMYMSDSGVLKILERDLVSGWVKTRRNIPADPNPSDDRGLGAVVLSPDRRWLYVDGAGTGGGIGAFRVLDGGELEFVPDAGCDCGHGLLEMTPDGSRLAVGLTNSVTVVERSPSGKLHDPKPAAWPPYARGNFVLSPDGGSVFAVYFDYYGKLEQYDVVADGLRLRRTYEEGSPGISGPLSVAASQDWRHVYVGGGTQLTTPSTISVFERTPSGELSHTSTFSPPLYTGRPFEGPPPSVAINGGDEYTNDPDVELTFGGLGRRDNTLQISNDGGFKPSETRYFKLGAAEPWTLARTGPDRLPKTVYVRVAGSAGVETLRDDIVLDETAPTLVSARRDGKKLRVKASDRVSGVSHIQVTRDLRKPGEWRRFKSRTVLPAGRGAIRVRARDRARNKSRWVTAR